MLGAAIGDDEAAVAADPTPRAGPTALIAGRLVDPYGLRRLLA